MVKILQCLKTSQICYFRHAERYAKNRTFLRGLDHRTLFFLITPYLLILGTYIQYTADDSILPPMTDDGNIIKSRSDDCLSNI